MSIVDERGDTQNTQEIKDQGGTVGSRREADNVDRLTAVIEALMEDRCQ